MQPLVGIQDGSQEGSYNEGRIRCRFTRQINPNTEQLADWGLLARPYHLMMGRGYSSLGMYSLSIVHTHIS